MKTYILKIATLIGILSISIASCSVQKKDTPNSNEQKIQKVITEIEKPKEVILEEFSNYKVELPKTNREFRGVWIATVANINWPSSRKLSTLEQKAEAIKLLDMLEDMNFNAVIFQVRPSADALYQSEHEPWSYFLTGETGKIPAPFYDPLQFWIEESHKRGMELHVWLNPYRAHHSNGGKVTEEALVKKMPNEIVRLKNGMYWFDPSNKKTQDHVSKVVNDLVKRYDIDGVHFDDYFYPYASYNGGADFPDNDSWNAYRANNGNLNRADWRRHNVNLIVERIYKEVKAEKSHVKFGISPFGIWKSGYPNGVTGMSQYDEIYADAKLWLNNGWIDYFTPQLYWPIDAPRQSFTKLLGWWNDENTKGRHLWPGLNTVEIKATDKAVEIVKQLQVTHDILNKSVGAIHYSMAGLTNNQKLRNLLKNEVYKEKALIPATTWIKAEKLSKPVIKTISENNKVELSWSISNLNQVNQWVLYKRYDNSWEMEIVNKNVTSTSISKMKNGQKLNAVAVRAIDRLGNESAYDAKKIQ